MSGQVVKLVLGWFRFFLFFGRLGGSRAPASGRSLLLAAAFFGYAQQRRVQPVADQRIHGLPRELPGTASGQVGQQSLGDLTVTDGVLAFAERLPEQLHFLLPHFGLGQNLALERSHARLIEREARLVGRCRIGCTFRRRWLSSAARLVFVRGTQSVRF